MESSIVVSGWECVARNLENQELAKYLMKQVIDKWIDIRIRSFVNSFMLVLRRKLAKGHLTGTITLAQKAESAMRKTLNLIFSFNIYLIHKMVHFSLKCTNLYLKVCL